MDSHREICPGLPDTSPSTSMGSPMSPLSDVSLAQHSLRLLPDRKAFECVKCRLVASDFDVLHSVPCGKSVENELTEQRQKLLRLKQLRERERVICNRVSRKKPLPKKHREDQLHCHQPTVWGPVFLIRNKLIHYHDASCPV